MKNKAVLSLILIFAMVLGSYSVLAVKDINVTPDSINIQGNSGDVFSTFMVQNIGNETVNVSLSVLNPLTGPGGRVINMTNLNIMPSTINPGSIGLGQFTVNLNNAVMGTYIGSLKAQVANDAESAFLVVNVNVTDNGQSFTVTSPPYNVTQTDTTIYQIITVQNNANHDKTVQVSKQGYDGMTFNVDKIGSQTLSPFGTMNIVASVVVPAGKAVGTYTGLVNVSDGIVAPKISNLGINVQPTYKASVSTVNINDVDPGQQKSQSFNIENKGNLDLSGLSLSNFTLTDNDGDKVNVTFSPSQGINVSVGASASISATADVSRKMDPATYSGQVTFTGTGISQSFTVSVEVNSLLKITDVEVSPDEVMPGEDFEVEVTVENTGDDVDLEDVEVEIFIMDGNDVLEDEDEDEVKDDVTIGDLGEGDEEKITLTFKMPYTTEDGDSFGVKVVAKGENADDSSEKYQDTYEDDNSISVERDEHKVEISANLEPSALSCVKTTYIEVVLKDIGANDEQVILTIKNDQLGMRVQDNFDMSSDYDDDEFEVSKSYLLDFTSAPVSTYPVTVVAENDDGDDLGSETVSVNIQDCSASPYTPPTTSGGSTGTSGTTTSTATETVQVQYTTAAPESLLGATVPAVSASPVISKAKRSSMTDSPLFIAVLVLANLLLLALVVMAFMYVVSGSKSNKKTAF